MSVNRGYLNEAEQILQDCPATERRLFERLCYHVKKEQCETTLSRGGIPRKVSLKQRQEHAAIAYELSLILSWQVKWTSSFWYGAALCVWDNERKKEVEA